MIEKNNNRLKISQRGLEDLQLKLENLQKERLEVLERRNVAREFGDLRENSEYSEAQQRLGTINTEIEDIMSNLESAIIFENIRPVLDYVDFGCKVTIENVSTKQKSIYCILGECEADLDKKIISEKSPIAQQMQGKKKNEQFSLLNGKTFLIIDLEYPENYDEFYSIKKDI